MARSATSARLASKPDDSAKRQRRLVTPEGVYLNLRLASPSDRVGAAAIDFAIVSMSVIALIIAILVAFQATPAVKSYSVAIAIIASFVFRIFYYPVCEFSLGGQTLGKRALNIRAIDRRGGPLTAEAIIARNFLREMELWLPLTALMSASANNSGDAWTNLLEIGWLLIISSFPLFTKDVMRLGDMVAGTWVIEAPKAELLPDLSQTLVPEAAFRFSRDQLEAYGEYELEVLAGILRDRTPGSNEMILQVASRIRAKIGWITAANEDPRAFLLAYYKALRGNLESRLVFGKRKLDKYNID